MIRPKWVLAYIAGLCFIGIGARAPEALAEGGSAERTAAQITDAAAKLQQRATERLERLARYLEQQATTATEDVRDLRSAITTNTEEEAVSRSLGMAESRSRSLVAKQALDEAAQGAPSSDPKAVAGGVVATVDEKAESLRTYAEHLRRLGGTLKDEAPEQSLEKIGETYVPPDVEQLLAPEAEAGEPAAASRGLAPAAEPEVMTRSLEQPNAPLEPTPPDLASGGATQVQLFAYGSGRVAGTGARATIDYPSVVAIYQDISSSASPQFAPWCTGTLIAPNAVLTAAHCFCEYDQFQGATKGAVCKQKKFRLLNGVERSALDPSYRRVFLQHGGTREIERVEIRDDFDFPKSDLALLFLKTPVFDVAPAAVNTASVTPKDTVATIVGFGRHGMLDQLGVPTTDAATLDAGLKFFAQTTTGACGPNYANKNLICWHFSGTGVVPQSVRGAGNTCNGDSGGPLFATNAANKTLLIGVTSGGMMKDCGSGDDSFDVEVFAYKDWIGERLVANPISGPAQASQSLDPFDNPGRYPFAKTTWQFHPSSQLYNWKLPLPSGLHKVCIGVNTDKVQSTPLRLRVVDSGGGLVKDAAGQALCDVETEDSAAACELSSGLSPDWRLEASGPGSKWFQIVATGF